MGLIQTNDTHYKSIANKIREKANTNRTYKPREMPGGIDSVYNFGYDCGYTTGELNGYANGITEGRQAEYDNFWNVFQENGERTDYDSAFASWKYPEIFKPKYNLKPKRADSMFESAELGDLAELLNSIGIELDFSSTYSFSFCFAYSKITRLGQIRLVNSWLSPVSYMCTSMPNLHTVDLIECTDKVKFSNAFNNCSNLQNIKFKGVIANNGLDLHWSTKLTKESIISVINVLSTTTSGLAVTLSEIAVNKAFETSTDANDGIDSNEWETLAATRSNWTISLV